MLPKTKSCPEEMGIMSPAIIRLNNKQNTKLTKKDKTPKYSIVV